MKVRILSGNETGAVKDLPPIEAQAAIDTGFAEAFVEEETRLAVQAIFGTEPVPRLAPKSKSKADLQPEE